DGKELGTQVSGLSLVEADVAVIFGVGRSDVVVFIEEALRSVGVRVDHDGGALNLLSFLADGVLCVDGNGKGEGKGEDSLVHGEQNSIRSASWWRAVRPRPAATLLHEHGWPGETPVAPPNLSRGSDSGQ